MTLKELKRLGEKKYRKETGLFYVEGKKNIFELFESEYDIQTLFVTKVFSQEIHEKYPTRIESITIRECTEESLIKAGTFTSNADGIAVAKQKAEPSLEALCDLARKKMVLVLDGIQDPGNLGTIIRTADWFGISAIIASPTTVDFYNPKVISSTMGSFTRVSLTYTNIAPLIERASKDAIPSYGALLEGESVYAISTVTNGFIILGSESHGIRADVLPHIRTHITIPRYGRAESLNVGIATGIILSHLTQ